MSIEGSQKAEDAQQAEANSQWVCSFPPNPFLDLVLEHKSYTATIKAWNTESDDECEAFVTLEATHITDGKVMPVADFESGDEAVEFAKEYADRVGPVVEHYLW